EDFDPITPAVSDRANIGIEIWRHSVDSIENENNRGDAPVGGDEEAGGRLVIAFIKLQFGSVPIPMEQPYFYDDLKVAQRQYVVMDYVVQVSRPNGTVVSKVETAVYLPETMIREPVATAIPDSSSGGPTPSVSIVNRKSLRVWVNNLG